MSPLLEVYWAVLALLLLLAIALVAVGPETVGRWGRSLRRSLQGLARRMGWRRRVALAGTVTVSRLRPGPGEALPGLDEGIEDPAQLGADAAPDTEGLACRRAP